MVNSERISYEFVCVVIFWNYNVGFGANNGFKCEMGEIREEIIMVERF